MEILINNANVKYMVTEACSWSYSAIRYSRQIFDLYWDSYLDVYRALKGFSLDANTTTLESSSPEEDSSDD
ncbi:hypothetical protein H0E87_027072 [Populus deltoides]|uniref:Uncharacterized protein n=1 Tax=Populus deltoides TaxID=3696 RepID=A0A8T2WZB7_POPDE|nr:hypothetical protein H0E87_027072 [Populus deltoides]